MDSPKPRFSDLMDLVRRLRGENGCPWDRKQTAGTMAPHLTEETYELVEAIFAGSPRAVREELGDVLFHIFFIANLYRETGQFDMADVVADIVEKMTRRHPHVFGDAHVNDDEDVKAQWHRIKGEEKKTETGGSRLASVPAGLPALMRAYRISDRVARAGFPGSEGPDRLETAERRWTTLKTALARGEKAGISTAMGEMLMELVHAARETGVHPDTALSDALRRFQARFEAVERAVEDQGRDLDDLSPGEKSRCWRAVSSAASTDGLPERR